MMMFLGAVDGILFYVYPTAEKVENLQNVAVGETS